jgi:hypothetical protein
MFLKGEIQASADTEIHLANKRFEKRDTCCNATEVISYTFNCALVYLPKIRGEVCMKEKYSFLEHGRKICTAVAVIMIYKVEAKLKSFQLQRNRQHIHTYVFM